MVALARKSDDDACRDGTVIGCGGEVTKVGEVVAREEVIALLRRAVSEAGGVRAFADKFRVNAASVSLTVNGKIAPPPAIANVFGLIKSEITVYRSMRADGRNSP